MSNQKVDTKATTIDNQLQLIEKGTQYIKLLRSATLTDGIQQFNNADRKDFIRYFDERAGELEIVKFVPASGAASRMFKKIQDWIESPRKHRKQIDGFFNDAEKLPFFEEWVQAADQADVETFQGGLDSKVKWLELLTNKGLCLAEKPKAIIPFHLDGDNVRTPIHEHILEAEKYGIGKNGAHIHFTVSEPHRKAFQEEVQKVISESGKGDVKVMYSNQKSHTDTVVTDDSFNPVLDEKGNARMRPGGHGALIHNLDDIEADVIFIKNIDNVCHPRLIDMTTANKKYLGGILLTIKSDFKLLHDQVSKGLMDATMIDQVRDKWRLRIPRDYVKLKEYLKRPIRVCGMVKNTGEPGGGPFWCLDKYTGESLQIVEKAQIDTSEMRQEMILNSAKYFNPVDIVCSTRDHKGQKINLMDFVDQSQYFISNKSLNGKEIKALEWPGLWNGAMAHWITVFAEVPPVTFNPVKEVQDLLRENHQ